TILGPTLTHHKQKRPTIWRAFSKFYRNCCLSVFLLLLCLQISPDRLVSQETKNSGQYQEGNHCPSGLFLLNQRWFCRPDQECRNVLCHLRYGRFCSVRIGYLIITCDWRCHSKVQVRKIRVVMQTWTRAVCFRQIRWWIGITGKQRIDIRSATFTCFGHQRKIWWNSIVVSRSSRNIICERLWKFIRWN